MLSDLNQPACLISSEPPVLPFPQIGLKPRQLEPTARGFNQFHTSATIPSSLSTHQLSSSGVLPLQPKKMTQDMFDPTSPDLRSHTPPLTDNHFLLPLPGAKYAPRTLTFKRRPHELTHFLEVYDHLCAHYHVTSEVEKCKGIVTYCTSKVGRTVEKLPSYIRGNYRELVKDLYYTTVRGNCPEDSMTFSNSDPGVWRDYGDWKYG